MTGEGKIKSRGEKRLNRGRKACGFLEEESNRLERGAGEIVWDGGEVGRGGAVLLGEVYGGGGGSDYDFREKGRIYKEPSRTTKGRIRGGKIEKRCH